MLLGFVYFVIYKLTGMTVWADWNTPVHLQYVCFLRNNSIAPVSRKRTFKCSSVTLIESMSSCLIIGLCSTYLFYNFASAHVSILEIGLWDVVALNRILQFCA